MYQKFPAEVITYAPASVSARAVGSLAKYPALNHKHCTTYQKHSAEVMVTRDSVRRTFGS